MKILRFSEYHHTDKGQPTLSANCPFGNFLVLLNQVMGKLKGQRDKPVDHFGKGQACGRHHSRKTAV